MFRVPSIWPNVSDYPIIDLSEESVFDSCQFPRVKRANLSMKKSWFFSDSIDFKAKVLYYYDRWCVLLFKNFKSERNDNLGQTIYIYVCYKLDSIRFIYILLLIFLFSLKKCQNQRFATILSIRFKAKLSHCSNVILIHNTTELKYIVS